MNENYKNFSFVIPNLLAGMSLPGKSGSLKNDLDFLEKQGIKAVVSLLEHPLNKEILAQYDMEYLHIAVKDFSAPSLSQIETFINFTNKMIQNKRPVAVHCYAGMGRTGTMLACYLVKEGMQPREAIREIRLLRPGSIEIREQEDAVWNFFTNIQ